MGETRRAYSRSYDFQAYIWAAVLYLIVVEALRRLWDEIEREYACFNLPHSNGLGVVVLDPDAAPDEGALRGAQPEAGSVGLDASAGVAAFSGASVFSRGASSSGTSSSGASSSGVGALGGGRRGVISHAPPTPPPTLRFRQASPKRRAAGRSA